MTKLLIVKDTAHSAAFNMAADMYLQTKCLKTNCVYVRFYTWSAPSITIGYSQNAKDLLDLDYLNSKGASWIRRPTGGRAVLHYEDITYSCIFPRTIDKMGNSINESYRIISQCLMDGFKKVGIECSTHDSDQELKEVRRDVKLPCFLAPNREEIMVNGKKLVGSAQKRTLNTVLQHGSIPFTDAYRSLPDFQTISDQEKSVHKRLLEKKSTCVTEINPSLSMSTLIDALVHGFASTLPFESSVTQWYDEDLIAIEQMVEDSAFQNQWMKD